MTTPPAVQPEGAGPLADRRLATAKHRGLLSVEDKALVGHLFASATGSIYLRGADASAVLSGKNAATFAANAYSEDGVTWLRYDTAQGAALFSVASSGGLSVYTVAAGANPITWVGPTPVVVGADSGWIAPALAANWSNFGGGQATAGYRKDAVGRVELKGLVKKATALALPDTLFTLPVGYRPATTRHFPVYSAGGFTSVAIFSNGAVQIEVGGSASFTCCDGIRFDPSV